MDVTSTENIPNEKQFKNPKIILLTAKLLYFCDIAGFAS